MRTISHLLPSLLSGLAIALTGSPLDVEHLRRWMRIVWHERRN